MIEIHVESPIEVLVAADIKNDYGVENIVYIELEKVKTISRSKSLRVLSFLKDWTKDVVTLSDCTEKAVLKVTYQYNENATDHYGEIKKTKDNIVSIQYEDLEKDIIYTYEKESKVITEFK